MHRHRLLLLLFVLLCSTAFVSPASRADEDPVGHRIAAAYGIEGWDQVSKIEFTFNVTLPDKQISRQWQWDVKHNVVTRTVDGESITLDRNDFQAGEMLHQSTGSQDHEVNQQFINDSYWLLFPFQLVWSNPTVTGEGQAALPIGDGEAMKVVCQWPSDGGYTPGDAYDLYLGRDGYIQQWVYRKGGGDEGRAFTWTDHQQVAPLVICLDHHNADETFRLHFTEVAVQLVGEARWHTPEPLPDGGE